MFKFEEPTLERKKDAIDYLNELKEHGSSINGTSGLDKYLEDYEGWLKKIEKDKNATVTDETVPKRVYFLVRCEDNKIVGMCAIRLKLNEKYMFYGRNIGYSIRPTERGKGYNKINLYLALKVCHEFGVEKALLDVDAGNIASWKTMEALGGHMDEEIVSILEGHDKVRFYSIDVEKSLKEYGEIYEPMIESNN